jgi:ABC-2 type transport system ATP-binding protein
MKAAIEVECLRKVFGRGANAVRAVDGLDLQVEQGAVYGLLGRNGAGKTTTLRLLAGVLAPSAGQAHVLGVDMRTARSRERSRFAYITQDQQLDRSLTGEQIASYLTRFYPLWDGARATDVAGRFGIPMDRRVGELSGGQQRVMAVILALAGRPEVLLLDEPAAGLDPVARRELIDVLVELLAEGSRPTILLSTHIVGDVERLADRVGMMASGQLHLEAGLDELQAECRRVQVVFESGQVPTDFAPPGVLRGHSKDGVWSGVLRAPAEVLAALQGTPAADVQLFPLGLEDLFVELFSREERA